MISNKRMSIWAWPSWLLALLICVSASQAAAAKFQVLYEVTVNPVNGLAHVVVKLEGKKLPSQVTFYFKPDRHQDMRSGQSMDVKEDGRVIWKPQAPESILSYDFVIDSKKDETSYDSRMTDHWALLRSDKLIPSMAVKASRKLKSEAELILNLPEGWSAAAPYEKLDDGDLIGYRLIDPGRRLMRPKGWLILGDIASRQDMIADTDVRIAAPREQNLRMQDTLAFLGWTLPALKQIFPDFPRRLLIVTAADPMWRGGLSGTRSLYMHTDRPLISGNRTSSLIHELVHVGTGIHGTDKSDWIVEGIAEFYAVEILHRTGAISDFRFQQTLDELASWGDDSKTLLTGDSSGPTTAKAAVIMAEIDREIRKHTRNKASLDDVATALASERGKVTVRGFRELTEQVAGKPLQALEWLEETEH